MGSTSVFQFSANKKFLLRSQKLSYNAYGSYVYRCIDGLRYEVIVPDLYMRATEFFSNITKLELSNGTGIVNFINWEPDDTLVLSLYGSSSKEGEFEVVGWRCVYSPDNGQFALRAEWKEINAKAIQRTSASLSIQPLVVASLTATRENPFKNSIGMRFVPVNGTTAFFSVWETRVQDYEEFVKTTGRNWDRPPFKQGPTHPAVRISWFDAKAFCEWLTERERRLGKLSDGAFYRLPTDVEWSHAVGIDQEYGSTPAQRDSAVPGYPWGDAWPPPPGAGNYDPSLHTDTFPFTSPVGSFSPNRYGIFDLGGNAYEWVEEFYDETETTRTVRGASWADGAEQVLSSLRFASKPDVHYKSYGFRIVLDVDKTRKN